jgi:hypothetical protein
MQFFLAGKRFLKFEALDPPANRSFFSTFKNENLLGGMPSWANFGLRVKNGGRSSMVEPRIVVPVVAGSNPVGHPKQKMAETRCLGLSCLD